MLEASASRFMRRPFTPSWPIPAAADEEDEDVSAQATPLARTPRRRSLDLAALTNLSAANTQNCSVENETLISSAASIISNSSSSPALEVPSLDPIPDEADVDDEDELTEHLALGLIDREHAAAVVAARTTHRAAIATSQALPSYSDSIGILG